MEQQLKSLLKEAKKRLAATTTDDDTSMANSLVSSLQNAIYFESRIAKSTAKKDLSGMGKEAWRYLYTFYAYDFLMGSNYEQFAQQISEKFILSAEQWDGILTEWELKEHLLTDKNQ